MSDLFSLKDQVAIVTGGSRGIGEAIALRLAEQGAAVVIAARKIEGCERVAAAIRERGGRALAQAFHAGDREAPAKLVAAAVAHFGKVDLLVNNAATNPYFGPLLNAEAAAYDKTFEVNLRGYFEMARHVAKHLLDRNAPGSIVNVASVVGMRGTPLQGVYAMSKAAVISMTQTMAVELGPANIRCNAIAPGLVDTRFASGLVHNEEIVGRILERTPLGRYAQPDEIAGAAVYLLSRASSFVTGQVLVVDGGSMATGL